MKTCAQTHNATLLSIKSEEKQTFVKNFINDKKINAHVWMSAIRIQTGANSSSFIWSDGDSLNYNNWFTYDPNGHSDGDNELHIYLS